MAHLKAHATEHVNGTDDIQLATAEQKGLATSAQITKLDGIETGADVTDTTNVAAAGAEMTANKNSANGYAGLNETSKLTGSQQVYGSGADTACEGNDARLSDARTPTAHDLAGAQHNGISGTEDNFMALDANGKPKDSTKSAASFQQIDADLNIKCYTQAAEPTLDTNENAAFWIDSDDSNRTYLIFRRGEADQVKVELA